MANRVQVDSTIGLSEGGMNMGKMGQLYTMLSEGASVTTVADQLQEWNRSIDRRTAIDNAYYFMKQWRETA